MVVHSLLRVVWNKGTVLINNRYVFIASYGQANPQINNVDTTAKMSQRMKEDLQEAKDDEYYYTQKKAGTSFSVLEA